jgi:phosphoribosylformylglycinamidine synthase
VHGGSRYPVFAHFDSDVQGHTVFRPGDADAGVLLADRRDARAIAIGTGGPVRLGKRDARRAGVTAVCEAVRNVVAVGATPWALTDCLNFGSPETPHGMQDLADAVSGLAEAATVLGLPGHPGSPLPFVSGNVSLYNESHSGLAIPPTPLVACFGVVGDASRMRSQTWRKTGDVLYRIGAAQTQLGGSVWAQVSGDTAVLQDGALPELDIAAQRDMHRAVLEAFDRRLVTACHDVSDGGELLALLEMSWDRRGVVRFGATWRPAARIAADDAVASLWSEAPGFVCAVPASAANAFESLLHEHGVICEKRGAVCSEPVLTVQGDGPVSHLDLEGLASRWRHALEDVLETQEVVA